MPEPSYDRTAQFQSDFYAFSEEDDSQGASSNATSSTRQKPLFQVVDHQYDDIGNASNAHTNPQLANQWNNVDGRISKVEQRVSRVEKALIGLKRKIETMIKKYTLGTLAYLSLMLACYLGFNFWQQQWFAFQQQDQALSLLLLDKVSSEHTDQWLRKKNLSLLAQSTRSPQIKHWATTEERIAASQQITESESFPTPVQTQLHWPLGNGEPNANKISYEPYRQGISIRASLGDPVVAVADGKIVYSSDELPGYGNLIIIEHDGGLMSIYGHNYANYVEKGDFVYSGQLIGVAGELPNSEPGLYFEIRNHGKAENPFSYLQPL
jgi:hypothetical protein